MVHARKYMCVVVVGTAACVRAYTHKAQVYKYIHKIQHTDRTYSSLILFYIYTKWNALNIPWWGLKLLLMCASAPRDQLRN